jgi:uncharacterized Fe-S cluster-containing radical SAM superfamily protein
MENKSRMYSDVTTWNPFKGCQFDCTYCKPSFQLQAKRQKKNCMDCYEYVPHEHPERLNHIPSAKTVFVCGNSDICFATTDYTLKIISAIHEHNHRCPNKEYYFQSKRPVYFKPFLRDFPDNVILLTTLETNRDDGYRKISKAPRPSKRYQQFKKLSYPRKVVTIEPVMNFDVDVFLDWVVELDPEYVWLGYNSRPNQVFLPEPSIKKMRKFIDGLRENNIRIKSKDLRGLKTR